MIYIRLAEKCWGYHTDIMHDHQINCNLRGNSLGRSANLKIAQIMLVKIRIQMCYVGVTVATIMCFTATLEAVLELSQLHTVV